MAADNQVWIPVSHSINILCHKKGVKGYVFHPTAVTFLRNCTKSA